ncbi:MAG TPA: carboxypeptidase regulatory-like domain-containing protein, partial [Candidatus Tripitaka sp. YC43]
PPPGLRAYPTICSTKAFTLLEIVSVIAIIGILGGTIAPLAFQLFTSKRGEVTVDRLEEFKKAIIGNPFVIGDDVRSSFGNIGDKGNQPTSVQDLYIPGEQPTYSYNSTLKTGAGWRGPYINPDVIEDLSTLRLDAYKQQLVYSTTAFTDTQTNASVVGALTSTGPNRTQGGGVADDRNVYIFQSEALATVSGFVKDTQGNRLGGVSVTINYPSNGTLTSSLAYVTGADGYFTFANIPYGNRSITVEPKLVYAPWSARTLDDTGDCKDGIDDDIELYVTNLSNAPISVERVKVFFDISTNPSANYRKLWLGSSSSTGCGNKQSGDPVSFDTTPVISGIPGAPPPGQSYIVRVQSPYTHIPDLRLQNYPSGTTVRMRIQDFQRTGSDSLNVSGIPFKAEFYSTWTGGPGGSGTLISTIYFTPNVN